MRFRAPIHVISSVRSAARSPLLQVIKTSVSAIVAWLLCVALLHQQLPIFAAIAALLVVQPSVNQSLAKGIERSVGVIVGVLLAFAAGALFGHSSVIVLGIIVVSLLVAWALQLSPGSANQIPISAMLVIAIGMNTPGYALNRVIETVIGAVVGLAINAIVVPPVLLTPAHDAVVNLAQHIASTLEDLATALRTPRTAGQLNVMLTQARALKGLRDAAAAALGRAEDSLMLNPRSSRYRHRIEADRALLDSLGVLVTRVAGMTRALHDNYDDALHTDRFVLSISTELSRASHDLLLMTANPSTAPDEREARPDEPTLTAPLVIPVPDAQNWVLVGALLEDLRRVREVIIGDSE